MFTLLVGCDPQFGIHRLVKFIKGATSHQLRQEFPLLKKKLPSLWTNSSSCGTTGGVTIETVRKDVDNQKGKEDRMTQKAYRYRFYRATRLPEIVAIQEMGSKGCKTLDNLRVDMRCNPSPMM
jgi:hypothetical protein